MNMIEGVTKIDVCCHEAIENFNEKWKKAQFLVLGCIYTHGISNFRKLRFMVVFC